MIIRVFVLLFSIVVAVDVAPDSWVSHSTFQRHLRLGLECLGIAQGEWSLFAPNPGMRTGFIVGEVLDREGNSAVWKSPDWSREGVVTKFFKFRHLNYYQRVVLSQDASIDLADYLHRSIPNQETVEPGIRLTETLNIVSSDPLVPPVSRVNLYHHHPLINLSYEEPIPAPSERVTSETDRFLVKRDYLQ